MTFCESHWKPWPLVLPGSNQYGRPTNFETVGKQLFILMTICNNTKQFTLHKQHTILLYICDVVKVCSISYCFPCLLVKICADGCPSFLVQVLQRLNIYSSQRQPAEQRSCYWQETGGTRERKTIITVSHRNFASYILKLVHSSPHLSSLSKKVGTAANFRQGLQQLDASVIPEIACRLA